MTESSKLLKETLSWIKSLNSYTKDDSSQSFETGDDRFHVYDYNYNYEYDYKGFIPVKSSRVLSSKDHLYSIYHNSLKFLFQKWLQISKNRKLLRSCFEELKDNANIIDLTQCHKIWKLRLIRRWFNYTKQSQKSNSIDSAIVAMRMYSSYYKYLVKLRSYSRLQKYLSITFDKVLSFLKQKSRQNQLISYKYWRVKVLKRRLSKRLSFRFWKFIAVCFKWLRFFRIRMLRDGFLRLKRRSKWPILIEFYNQKSIKRCFQILVYGQFIRKQQSNIFLICNRRLYILYCHKFVTSLTKLVVHQGRIRSAHCYYCSRLIVKYFKLFREFISIGSHQVIKSYLHVICARSFRKWLVWFHHRKFSRRKLFNLTQHVHSQQSGVYFLLQIADTSLKRSGAICIHRWLDKIRKIQFHRFNLQFTSKKYFFNSYLIKRFQKYSCQNTYSRLVLHHGFIHFNRLKVGRVLHLWKMYISNRIIRWKKAKYMRLKCLFQRWYISIYSAWQTKFNTFPLQSDRYLNRKRYAIARAKLRYILNRTKFGFIRLYNYSVRRLLLRRSFRVFRKLYPTPLGHVMSILLRYEHSIKNAQAYRSAHKSDSRYLKKIVFQSWSSHFWNTHGKQIQFIKSSRMCKYWTFFCESFRKRKMLRVGLRKLLFNLGMKHNSWKQFQLVFAHKITSSSHQFTVNHRFYDFVLDSILKCTSLLKFKRKCFCRRIFHCWFHYIVSKKSFARLVRFNHTEASRLCASYFQTCNLLLFQIKKSAFKNWFLKYSKLKRFKLDNIMLRYSCKHYFDIWKHVYRQKIVKRHIFPGSVNQRNVSTLHHVPVTQNDKIVSSLVNIPFRANKNYSRITAFGLPSLNESLRVSLDISNELRLSDYSLRSNHSPTRLTSILTEMHGDYDVNYNDDNTVDSRISGNSNNRNIRYNKSLSQPKVAFESAISHLKIHNTAAETSEQVLHDENELSNTTKYLLQPGSELFDDDNNDNESVVSLDSLDCCETEKNQQLEKAEYVDMGVNSSINEYSHSVKLRSVKAIVGHKDRLSQNKKHSVTGLNTIKRSQDQALSQSMDQAAVYAGDTSLNNSNDKKKLSTINSRNSKNVKIGSVPSAMSNSVSRSEYVKSKSFLSNSLKHTVTKRLSASTSITPNDNYEGRVNWKLLQLSPSEVGSIDSQYYRGYTQMHDLKQKLLHKETSANKI